MKKIAVIVAMVFSFGLFSAQAQDYKGGDPQNKTANDRRSDHADKSKVGKKLHNAGSKVGSGAKWT
jgi:hypothetical protein